jgi:hypothetical protein
MGRQPPKPCRIGIEVHDGASGQAALPQRR